MTLFKTILRVVLVLSIVVFAIFAVVRMQNRTCSGVQVNINYKGVNSILTEEDILQQISTFHIKTVNEKLKTIPLEKIKQILSNDIYIKKINEISFSGTKLIIDVTLREMLLHVFLLNGNSYFVDYDGIVIPYTSKIKEKLIIVNGNIFKTITKNENILDKPSTIKSIFNIATLINQDSFLSEKFKQIYVNDQNIIELVPSDGSLNILFGDEIDAVEKLFKIKEMYSNILPYTTDKKYKSIDVRFKNRVIANKANI
jgi:cell division protein FtsQ